MRKSDKQGRDAVLKFSEHKRKRVDDLDDDLDALFRLPLAEFTGARNALAAQLKKSGRGDDAVLVKALAKPSISAWAVNQLYWNHRKEFDRLIALGDRFHKAQKSGKLADMRETLDARREALTDLTDLATSVLRDAGPNPGQNPAPDTIHRITTTLEGISAYASRSDGPRAGRLTHDVDPPGFESFAGFSSGTGLAQLLDKPARVTTSQKSNSAATNARRKVAHDDDVRRVEEARKAKIAAARVSLQDAKRSLTEARSRAQSLEAAKKKGDAEAKKTEKQRREAEEELRRAKAAFEAAARRARSVTVEVEEAAKAVEEAELTVAEASQELESLLREPSGR
jgi:hypothetical protein